MGYLEENLKALLRRWPQPPHIVIPAKAGIQSQRRGSQSTLKQWAGPVFIPLCGLRKAIVIPEKLDTSGSIQLRRSRAEPAPYSIRGETLA